MIRLSPVLNALLVGFFVIYSGFGLSQTDLRGNETPTYSELIALYEKLAQDHEEIELYEMGPSDYGLPIYLCIVNGAGDSISSFQKAKSSTTVLINNAIHPGEPDGVNACLLYLEEWISAGKKLKSMPLVAIIPAYNIGGMMQRSGTSRANQNGPEEYGFRGNAQNLDLNRDAIKADSKNMNTFAKIFHALDPDVFMDTHVTNGADYQYTMTYISGMRERMPQQLGDLVYEDLIPFLEKESRTRDFPLIPYVNLRGETPDTGIEQFNDLPRYIQGFAALFHSIAFTLETHMLKPFPERVEATKVFIEVAIEYSSKKSSQIEEARRLARVSDLNTLKFPIRYELSEAEDRIEFLGFEHSYDSSSITAQTRLKYHRDKPYKREIPIFHNYRASDTVKIPKYYIVGAQCSAVIERLQANGIEMEIQQEFSNAKLNGIRILQFESPGKPYEGHFLHSGVHSVEEEMNYTLKPGDVLVPCNQEKIRFIQSVLEPKNEDSYFAWNFFDSYMQQKEYFSTYVFEEKAAELLENESIRLEFEKRKSEDPDFANSRWDQLYFLYQRSPYFEKGVNLLPIYKMY